MLNTLVKPNNRGTYWCFTAHLTGKYVKNNSQTSAVHEHVLFCKTVVCPEDFSILAKSSCNFKDSGKYFAQILL